MVNINQVKATVHDPVWLNVAFTDNDGFEPLDLDIPLRIWKILDTVQSGVSNHNNRL